MNNQEQTTEIKPLLKCLRCYGRGFFMKADGYTMNDRVHCHKCDGLGLVTEYRKGKNMGRKYNYRYCKEGTSE